MKPKFAILAILIPALLAQAAGNGNGNGNSNGRGAKRTRGKVTGSYSLVIAGQYTGKGTASVDDASITLSGTVFLPNGATGSFSSPAMTLTNNRFDGNGTINGVACTITGRVDLPDATDQETTDDQALTGRISATVRDSSGKTARIIGVQDATSRSGKPATKPAK